MIDITAFEDAIMGWIEDVLTIQAIVAHPNAKRPNGAYAVINIMNSKPLSTKDTNKVLEVDKTTTINYSTTNNLLVSINVYRTNAFYNANKLRDSLQSVSVSESLYTAGLGYLKTGDVIEADEVINEKWEERARFDVEFAVRTSGVENIESIQRIEIENTVIIKP